MKGAHKVRVPFVKNRKSWSIIITLYYKPSQGSYRQSVQWFEEHQIEVVKKRLQTISRAELLDILRLTDNDGFTYILKHSSMSTICLQEMIENIEDMSFNKVVDFVLNHLEVL